MCACVHKHARVGGSVWGMLPQENFKIGLDVMQVAHCGGQLGTHFGRYAVQLTSLLKFPVAPIGEGSWQNSKLADRGSMQRILNIH